jgi:phosphomannomutase
MLPMVEPTYRCPGESYDISRAVHLGRLTASHAACLHCEHRTDLEGLPASARKLIAAPALREQSPTISDDSLGGICGEALDATRVRRFAQAYGLWLHQQTANKTFPHVVLASDDRPITAELVAASSEGLRYSQCNVIDIGGATAAALKSAMAGCQADGAVLVGNSRSLLRTATVSCWGTEGRPIACGGGQSSLEELWQFAERGVDRPGRQFGGWQRGSAEAAYLDTLRPYFHALRPLEFRLDTSCRPLERCLDKLLANVACRAWSPSELAARTGGPLHFGLWIDGNGERLRLFDEAQREIPGEHLLRILALHLLHDNPGDRIVVEADTPPGIVKALRDAGASVTVAGPGRADMDEAMRASAVLLGGGPSGRFYFPGRFPAIDALHVLALLLTVLSQSDRPLSTVAGI